MAVVKSPIPDVPLRDISVTQQFFEGLAKAPDQNVLIDGPTGAMMTAATLRDRIMRFAGGLVARGLGRGATLALMAPNMPDFATVFHGVAWAGGTITTINPTYTAIEVHQQLHHAKARTLVTIPAFLAVAQEAAAGTDVAEIVVIGGAPGLASLDDWLGEASQEQVAVDLVRDTLVIPYSSGTTGLPKGVMLSHRNLCVNVDQIARMRPLSVGEITVAFLPFFHIYGMTAMLNYYVSQGARLVTMPRFDLESFLRHIQTHRVREVFIAPPVAVALAKHPMVDQFDLSSLKVLFSGAAPLGGDVADAVATRLDCQVVQGYGLTETSPVTHATTSRAMRAGSVGPLAPNTQARIVAPETGCDLGCDQPGELWIKGPQVMLGYLDDPDATALTLTDGWLRTGDLAEVDADGFFYIRDRLKELIKVRGFQVAPAEVEAALLSLPEVADAAVIGIPDDAAGEVAMAFIVAAAGRVVDAVALQTALRTRLAGYKVPALIEVVDVIPKSASGKILRRLLRDRARGGAA